MENKNKHGGPRLGAGRPTFENVSFTRRNIMIDDERCEKIKRIFGGNLSESLRAMIDEYK